MEQDNNKKGEFIKFVVLVWSAGLLTASYAGWMEKMDPTYVASILSGTLATFSITREKNK
jgi:hypothetical protein|tara:strand:- start:565 stop:744 length:180 start_codon:yes stop_codon:yes gene_type:complete